MFPGSFGTCENVTARLTSPSVAAYISDLVHQHHSEFRKVYPDVVMTPKLHYMVHFARQMIRYVYQIIIACVHYNCI